MSVPRSLELPPGVSAASLETSRGTFAAQVAFADDPVGHVLLIPGWTGSKEDFTPLLPRLAAAGYDVTAYDQRGQYETVGRPNDDYSLAGLAADALAVREKSGRPTSHVLGHSFGGLVAQHAVLHQPEAFRSLGLLCTGPGALGDSDRRPLKKLASAIGKVPLLHLHELRESGVKRPAQITAFLARRFTSNSPAALKAMTQHLIDAPDVVDQVLATGVPVWVGRGADDDAWPHDVQALMAQRLGTEIHVIADSAHSPAVENPDGVMAAWSTFLRER